MDINGDNQFKKQFNKMGLILIGRFQIGVSVYNETIFSNKLDDYEYFKIAAYK